MFSGHKKIEFVFIKYYKERPFQKINTCSITNRLTDQVNNLKKITFSKSFTGWLTDGQTKWVLRVATLLKNEYYPYGKSYGVVHGTL